MKRACGFILFWLAIGIAIGMYLQVSFISLCIIIVMMICGFNLFSSCN